MRLSADRLAVETLRPMVDYPSALQRHKTYPLLEQLYARMKEPIALSELKDRKARDSAAEEAGR